MSEENKSGCFKSFCIGCLIMVVLAIVGGIVLIKNSDKIASAAKGKFKELASTASGKLRLSLTVACSVKPDMLCINSVIDVYI